MNNVDEIVILNDEEANRYHPPSPILAIDEEDVGRVDEDIAIRKVKYLKEKRNGEESKRWNVLRRNKLNDNNNQWEVE